MWGLNSRHGICQAEDTQLQRGTRDRPPGAKRIRELKDEVEALAAEYTLGQQPVIRSHSRNCATISLF
ncbi:MAG: hypothetical protein HC866_12310, partial [Leptolyngbyaceae cyanobacterium RU_5_1]|nr:hypothetical protein [Leptolyngbyaceae cyanobacterium RU_5_1]